MVALSDNRLDMSFKETGNPSPHMTFRNSDTDPMPALSVLTDGLNFSLPEGEVLTQAYPYLGYFKSWANGPWSTGSDDPVNSVGRGIKVTPGEKLRVSMGFSYVGSTTAWAGSIFAPYISLYFFSGVGGYITNANSTSTGTRPSGVSLTATVPNGGEIAVVYLRLRVSNPTATVGPFRIFINDPYFGASDPKGGVAEVSASTEARLGIVADVYSRSREKINLELAGVDRQLIAGERIELAAAAMTASSTVWHWRQVTGPPVVLQTRDSTVDFIAPDVSSDTPVRIGVYAASEDGRNRSDWHYFDLTIQPALARFRDSDDVDYTPVSPKYVGYDRGKREIWNDVIAPPTFTENPRHEVEKIDLGIMPDDVQFSTIPPDSAAAGGIYIDPTTGDIYRNFGAGYNETDDTLAAPRTNAWWVNPATGDILEWIED